MPLLIEGGPTLVVTPRPALPPNLFKVSTDTYRVNNTLPAPRDDAELRRVIDAPQRAVPDADQLEIWREKWTRRLEIPSHAAGCGCPIRRLNGPQAWALEEASKGEYGILGSLKVGSGKTGLDVLLAMVVPKVRSAVLLIPPALRAQFANDFAVWGRHFRVPNLAGASGLVYPDCPVLRVLAYSELSRAGCTEWFAAYRPDLIIADECQALQDRKSVRTHRFIRHFASCPDTIYCGYSGSLTTRSVEQYAHQAALSLRERSPLPIDPVVTSVWAAVLDPEVHGGRAPDGALRKFCDGPLEDVRSAFRRRMTRTPGVITTEDSRLDVSVTVRVRDPGPIPPAVTTALQTVRMQGKRPDGQDLEEASEIAAYARQVATGMFTRWKFPSLRGLEGQALALEIRRIEGWFARRKDWGAELRDRLNVRSEHMDSPELCTNAAKRALEGYKGKLPVWHAKTWAAWAEVKDTVRHEDDVVWLHEFLIEDAARWASRAPGIVWVEHPAFGHLLAKRTGMPYFGAGEEASTTILKEDGTRSIIASVKAHGTGKNLQAFNRALMIDTPSDAGIVEQMIGRLYRHGQRRDVLIERYEHTFEYVDAWAAQMTRAEYVRETTGTVYAVLFAED